VGLREAQPDAGGQRRPTLKVIEREIPYRGRGTEVRIYPLADLHLGERATDETRLDAALDEIDADAGGYWLTLGDNCSFINVRDPRFKPDTLAPWLYQAMYDHTDVGLGALQRDELARRIRKRKTLGRKLLAAVEGNHEEDVQRHCEVDSYVGLIERIRDTERQLCLGPSGYLVLRFRRQAGKDEAPSSGNTFTLRLFLAHGWGAGQGGTPLKKLDDMMRQFDADIYLLGHYHVIDTHAAARPITLDAELRLIQPPDRLGAVCGTFLRSRIADTDIYSEVRGMRPGPASTDVVIRVQPDKGTYSLEVRNSNKAALL